MLCKIADLIVDIPATGDMLSRCREYLVTEKSSADIIIRADLYNYERYKNLNEAGVIYMESGLQFARALVDFDGFYLHSAAIEHEGKAYLFSGPSGVGKSTHTGLWKQLLGDDKVVIINDDKPPLRRIDGRWYAYGSPWSGKHGINCNKKVELAGICFLRRGEENAISRLNGIDAVTRILLQTPRRFENAEKLDRLLSHITKLVSEVPVYEFYNLPIIEAAQMSYETMHKGAEEMLK